MQKPTKKKKRHKYNFAAGTHETNLYLILRYKILRLTEKCRYAYANFQALLVNYNLGIRYEYLCSYTIPKINIM